MGDDPGVIQGTSFYRFYFINFFVCTEVKRPGRGVDHPSHLVPGLKKE
jgi:hypothetical protein